MKNDLADLSTERYVVEIDGIANSEYRVFVRALTAGLQLKQEFPEQQRQIARRIRRSGIALDVQSLAEFSQKSALN